VGISIEKAIPGFSAYFKKKKFHKIDTFSFKFVYAAYFVTKSIKIDEMRTI
jgi:hypothetical protein